MNTRTLLREEIQNELEELRKMELGNEKYKVTVDGLTKLIDRSIEFEKIDIQSKERIEDRNVDLEFKEKENVDEQKDRLIKNGIAVAGIVIPAALTIWGTIVSLNFEKEGTVTTTIGRGFINKLIPKK